MKRIIYGALFVIAAATPCKLSAQLTFGNTPFTLSNTAGFSQTKCFPDPQTDPAPVPVFNQVTQSGSTITMVDNVFGNSSSAFTTAAQNISALSTWSTSFDFSMSGSALCDTQADGFAFVLQSNSNNIQGGGGGGIGYDLLSNSAAFGFRSWDNNDAWVGTNGSFTPFQLVHANWGLATLVTGTVNLSYNGLGTVSYSLVTNLGDNLSGSLAFNESGLTAGNVFLGFVAGTGASTSKTDISNWSFSSRTPANVVPEPATMTLMATGLVGLMGAKRRRRKA